MTSLQNKTLLPESLGGKTIARFNDDECKFLQELVSMGCHVISYSSWIGERDNSQIDAFTFDATAFVGEDYSRVLMERISQFKQVPNNRFCYALIPYVLENSNWDIYNMSVVSPSDSSAPGARWVIDQLLRDFSMRSLGGSHYSELIQLNVMHCRLEKIKPTVLCIMAQSGQGKTTLVRQLTRDSNQFHVSSDFLLSNLINVSRSSQPIVPEEISNLVEKIRELGDEVWSHFFRLLDEDHQLLQAFLKIIQKQMELNMQGNLLSLDIDLREEASREVVRKFFLNHGYKVWNCTI